MVPISFITAWRQQAPWLYSEQVEQDLVICRALVEIFTDDWLASRLAFRGGTALHKLYLQPQPRFSEDIDLVQITAEPFGPVVDRIRERLAFLGEPKRSQKAHNFTLFYRFESETPPVFPLKLKVETNTREHFCLLGFQYPPFAIRSEWFEGNCLLTTYCMEELLATKMRALYQRKKGRDLYDLYTALIQTPTLDIKLLLECYRTYMKFSVENPPSQREFLANLEAKIIDSEFLGDTKALLRPGVNYDPLVAYEVVKSSLVDLI
jgi:predicted nucleotidyltransferase component of viral defense system